MCRVRHPREPRGRTMSFVKDNEKYERWLRKHCRVVEADLKKKHERMRESAFVFLRATFFRWAKRVEGICTDLAKTPPVLSVGDLHLEISVLGAMRKGDWSGASTISTRLLSFPTRSTWSGLPPARGLPPTYRSAIARSLERSSMATAMGSNGRDRHCSTSRNGGCDPMWP